MDLGTDPDWTSLAGHMKSSFATPERTVQVPPATRNGDVEGRAEMRKTEERNQVFRKMWLAASATSAMTSLTLQDFSIKKHSQHKHSS